MYPCSLAVLLVLGAGNASRVSVSSSFEADSAEDKSSAEVGPAFLVDVTDLIASEDAAGNARCCCDVKVGLFGGKKRRSGICGVYRGIKKCGGLPKTIWASGTLHHYKRGYGGYGRCRVAKNVADKVQKEYGSPNADLQAFKYMTKVGPGFWNIRAPLKMFGLNVGTHMSLAQLADGNFVAIDTIELSPAGLKEEIDLLTQGGTKIVAVLGTHPFHTLFFPGFNKAYPSGPNRQYFGAPRHLRKFPDINWAGPITTAFGKWPELDMLIPEGGEFDDPKPPDYNHLMNVFVFHKPSKTVHDDDCVMVVQEENMDFKSQVASIFFKWMKPGMHFHPSLTGPGLYESPDAPAKFKASMERVLAWDFDNLCTAHNGNSIGDAKYQFEQLLADTEKTFQKLASAKAKKEKSQIQGNWSDNSGGECG